MSILSGKDSVAIAFHKEGVVSFLRGNAYVNLSDVAKPFNKRMSDWLRLKQTKSLIERFESDPSYNGNPAIYTKEGRTGGTWAHPDIAIQFAQWCDPGFALWVSRQIRHLLTYGEVNIHHREWTREQYQQGIFYNREDIRDLFGR